MRTSFMMHWLLSKNIRAYECCLHLTLIQAFELHAEHLIMDGEAIECNVEDKEAKDNKEVKKNVKVKVLFFARARDLAGISDKVLVMEEGSTTLDCVNKLLVQLPSLKEIYDCMAVALNETYTTESAVVKDGDELALIPPISGG
eukprot:Gb_03351 [translate_table: standard]